MTRKGGASIEQIGTASIMRSWFTDKNTKMDLNDIVHSADKDVDKYNIFKDITNSYDQNVENVKIKYIS